MKAESILSKILLTLLSIVIIFSCLEIAMRVYLRYFASEDSFRKYASLNQIAERYAKQQLQNAYSPHRYLGYYPTPNYQSGMNKHNSLGFRGEEIQREKPQGVFRIVCLGESTTYGMTDNYRETYPYQLQEALHKKGYSHVEVINAGAGNYASWESLINFEFRVLELKPDLITAYHGMNDIYSRLVWPPSAYRGDNSGARIASVRSLRMPPIWHYSTLIRFFLVRLGFTQPHSTLDWNLIDYAPTWYALEHMQQCRRNLYPAGVFLKVPAIKMLNGNPPKFFESNLRSIIAIAKANNIEVVLLTFATSPFFPEEPSVSSREYRRALAEHNEIIRKFAPEINVFDFANVMPVDAKYYEDGYHFTPLGNELFGKLLADYLIEHHLIK